MFKPLYWLFRSAGLYPTNTKEDKYWAAVGLGFQLLSFCGQSSVFYSQLDWNSLGTYINLVLHINFSMSGIIHSLKVLWCTHSFSKLVANVDRTSHSGVATPWFEIASFIMVCKLLGSRVLVRCLTESCGVEVLLRDVGTIITYLSIVQQSVMVRQLTAGFSALNHQLTAVYEAPPRALRAELASVFRAHARLRDLVKEINTLYATYNIPNSLGRLFSIAYMAYSILVRVIVEAQSMLWLTTIVLLTAMIVTIYQMEVCYQCSNKANETVKIAHGIVNEHNTTVEVMGDIAQFSLTMFNNPVTLSAGGVFTLDRAMITKATMASVTCIIIALQLRDVQVLGVEVTLPSTSLATLQY